MDNSLRLAPGEKDETCLKNNLKAKRAGGIVQVVENLQALSSGGEKKKQNTKKNISIPPTHQSVDLLVSSPAFFSPPSAMRSHYIAQAHLKLLISNDRPI
jgi:hypothetical protein